MKPPQALKMEDIDVYNFHERFFVEHFLLTLNRKSKNLKKEKFETKTVEKVDLVFRKKNYCAEKVKLASLFFLKTTEDE